MNIKESSHRLWAIVIPACIASGVALGAIYAFAPLWAFGGVVAGILAAPLVMIVADT